jgi:hypothetical protein
MSIPKGVQLTLKLVRITLRHVFDHLKTTRMADKEAIDKLKAGDAVIIFTPDS